MTVMVGTPLFRINGLSTIWVNAEVPENQAAQILPGNAVEARAAAVPGIVFKGRISAILPEVNATTRTIKARVELANPDGRLVPGMFTTVSFTPASRKNVLTVPSEAIIQTGKRSVVIVAQGDGRFLPTDVETGLDSGGRTEIRTGLALGQKVVVSGQFLVDSEASLRGTSTRMSESDTQSAEQAPSQTRHGEHGDGKTEAMGSKP
jgi:Cu(I)/Ag(I) efflux system membrane fusion protein